MIKEINYLKEHLYEIYKYKKSQKDLTYDMDLELLLRTCKALDFIQRENNQLQSNWNSLRDELKQAYREIFEHELVNDRELINNILDKMNELEGKSNDN